MMGLSWEAYRGLFDLDPEVAFLDAMIISSHPEPVRRAIERHQRGLDVDPATYIDDHWHLADMAAQRLAELVGFGDPEGEGPERVALTDSTTMGLGLVYGGLDLPKDHHILLPDTSLGFTTNAVALRFYAEDADEDKDPRTTWRKRVRCFTMYDQLSDVSEDALAAAVISAVRPETAVVGLTWVSSSTGLMLPIRRICDDLKSLNKARAKDRLHPVIVVVDAAHALGVVPFDFDELGADFLVAGCHKWLFGPRGTGCIIGTKDAWPSITPSIDTFRGTKTDGRRNSPGGIHSYANRWALADAVSLHLRHGSDRIWTRTRELFHLLAERLERIPGISLVTPRQDGLSAGVLCCAVEGHTARDAKQLLRHRFRVSCMTSMPDRDGRVYLCFSPSIRNNESDIEAAAKALEHLAGNGA